MSALTSKKIIPTLYLLIKVTFNLLFDTKNRCIFMSCFFLLDIIEEEEAFHAYAEQRRYASTLGRSCLSSGTPSRSRREAEKESEKLRGLKGNISRFVRGFYKFSSNENFRNLWNKFPFSSPRSNRSKQLSHKIIFDFSLLYRVKRSQPMPNGQCQE